MAQTQDSLRLAMTAGGLEGRPFSVCEVHPLSGTEVDFGGGYVSETGELELVWPDDHRLHFFKLRCGGAEWSLPVCGEEMEVQGLRVTQRGAGPFSARPGELMVGPNLGSTPLVLGHFSNELDAVRASWAVDFQRSMLWGEGMSKTEVSKVLGAEIVQGKEAVPVQELGVLRLDSALRNIVGVHSVGRAAPVAKYMMAMAKSIEVEFTADRLAEFLAHWRSAPAPDPADASAVLNFTTGLDLFARTEGWSEAQVLAHSEAIRLADMEGFVRSTAAWWGGEDEDKTTAWLLYRMGRDAFGVKGSGVPFSSRVWRQAWVDLFARLTGHAVYGAEFRDWRKSEAALDVLPGDLRAFDAAENLIRLEDLVGSGPAVWLWLDAGAPSTTLQLQVLEEMLKGNEGRKLQRSVQWVVVDAGNDFEAFQQLIRNAARRSGGLSKMPFFMVHTGGDLRWSKAFDVSALPAIRMHKTALTPVSEQVPLPGPELMLWLARQP